MRPVCDKHAPLCGHDMWLHARTAAAAAFFGHPRRMDAMDIPRAVSTCGLAGRDGLRRRDAEVAFQCAGCGNVAEQIRAGSNQFLFECWLGF
jgi:hypothetical protein